MFALLPILFIGVFLKFPFIVIIIILYIIITKKDDHSFNSHDYQFGYLTLKGIIIFAITGLVIGSIIGWIRKLRLRKNLEI